MSKSDYPKFQKINKNTIKVTVEKSQDVNIEHLLSNKEMLLAQKQQIEEQLKHMQEVIDNAKRLGIDIIPKPIPNPKIKLETPEMKPPKKEK